MIEDYLLDWHRCSLWHFLQIDDIFNSVQFYRLQTCRTTSTTPTSRPSSKPFLCRRFIKETAILTGHRILLCFASPPPLFILVLVVVVVLVVAVIVVKQHILRDRKVCCCCRVSNISFLMAMDYHHRLAHWKRRNSR